ncbi:ATP-binding protein [Pseudoalteromonas sp. OANN1]|uniref:ATP-binding protein n=1 Tax=Pseudoalteromonas sp. OANN1 TaxID=2954497 RepID=UPI002097FCE4|nr:ATP-binding protein [Pseudoalteromonas sp. OANN1]MCO7199597.1 ATP-binding protein [Pseudoalteromonas sp. OANN1]
MDKKEIPAQAGKLLSAVASIGYDPEVALCDLIDNSIDASSETINIYLTDNVLEEYDVYSGSAGYVISDDGIGMDERALLNAFTLGSHRDYPTGSLGKFGLGLKSAGLSLGDRITILTSQGGEVIVARLSIEDVIQSGKYQIEIGPADEQQLTVWEKYSITDKSGTILIVDQLNDTQPSFSTFIDYFSRYCSNVYHLIIEQKDVKLAVNSQPLEPIDPLFEDEAQANSSLINPNEWNGKTPHLLLNEQVLNLDEKVSCKIMATHLIHPPSFEEEGRRDEVRASYQIEKDPYTRKDRHGFYIYRNNRIIVMAERFRGIVSAETSAWAFRGRLVFDESADDILHLDVKKRHMRLPATARNNLKHIIGSFHTKSVNAWKAAGEKYKKSKGEQKEKFANDSISKAPISNLDYTPGSNVETQSDMQKRGELQAKISRDTEKDITDAAFNADKIKKEAEENNSIILVEGLRGNPMWLPYPATELKKAEVLVNTHNSWISEAIKGMDDNPHLSLVLYQMFAIMSRAELELRSTPYDDISSSVIERVFERFRKKASAISEDLSETLTADLAKIQNGSFSDE